MMASWQCTLSYVANDFTFPKLTTKCSYGGKLSIFVWAVFTISINICKQFENVYIVM